MANAEIEQFLSAIGYPHSGHRSFTLKVLAVKLGEHWANLISQLLLSFEENRATIDGKRHGFSQWDMMTCGPLLRIEADHNMAMLPDVLKRLSFGRIGSDEQEVLCVNDRNASAAPLNISMRYQFLSRERSQRQFNFNHPLDLLECSYSSFRDFVGHTDEIERALFAEETPFESLDDFASDFLMLGRKVTLDNSCCVQVVAPVSAIFEESSSMRRGRASIVVRTLGDVRPDSVSIGIVEEYLVDKKRSTIPLVSQGYKIFENPTKILRKVPKCRRMKCYLRIGEMVKDSITLSEQLNLPFLPRALSHFDPEFANLRLYLAGKGNNPADDFEVAVSVLLSGLSFISFPLGLMRVLREPVDGIAFCAQSNTMLIYECTTGSINSKDKLSKLLLRWKGIEKEVRSVRILPVIFTSLEKESILKDDLEKAHRAGIVVATKETIDSGLSLMQSGAEPVDMVELLIR